MNHNLDDLIIDEPELESPKPKNLLSKLALIIIVLIVGIVISKLIISDKGDPVETVKDKELAQITDPSQTDPEIAKLAKEESFEKDGGALDKDLTPINQETPKEDDINLEDTNFDSDYGSANFTPVQNLNQPETKPQVNKPKPTPKPAAPAKEPPKPKPAPVKQQKPKQKPTTPKPVKRASLVGKYFIQVGSFSKKPSPKYLNSIKQKGYTPFVIESGNLYKVRVGPFNSFADAKAKLPAVNSALNTQGFVVKYIKAK